MIIRKSCLNDHEVRQVVGNVVNQVGDIIVKQNDDTTQ